MAQLEVEIVAADNKIWSGGANMVVAPAADGEIGILPGHSPLLAALRAGEVRITAVSGEPFRGTIDGGFLSVDSNRVTIVAATVAVITSPSAR